MAAKSPTVFHSYWGSYAGPANLPNVAAAPTQDAALQAGDIAFESINGRLYLCTNPALGAAVWALIQSGAVSTFDPAELVQRNELIYVPVGTVGPGTQQTVLGAFLVNTGNTVARAVNPAGSFLETLKRYGHRTAAAINSIAGVLARDNMYFRGSAAGRGGFRFVGRFGVVEVNAGDMRMMCGMTPGNTAFAAAAEPSTALNSFFVGADSTDANLQVMHNDGAGACTKIDLGAGMPFPGPGNVDCYQVELTCAVGVVTEMAYTVTRLDTGAVVSGTINADLPTVDTLVKPEININSGPTNAVLVGIDEMGFYVDNQNAPNP